MKTTMEGLIHHFKYFSEGIILRPNEIYSAVEAPKGEFGIYLVSNGTNKPYRCKIRAPGFNHLQGLNFMVENSFIADLQIGHFLLSLIILSLHNKQQHTWPQGIKTICLGWLIHILQSFDVLSIFLLSSRTGISVGLLNLFA